MDDVEVKCMGGKQDRCLGRFITRKKPKTE